MKVRRFEEGKKIIIAQIRKTMYLQRAEIRSDLYTT